jgi:hypothetical protein
VQLNNRLGKNWSPVIRNTPGMKEYADRTRNGVAAVPDESTYTRQDEVIYRWHKVCKGAILRLQYITYNKR